jgi:hypothetical protein
MPHIAHSRLLHLVVASVVYLIYVPVFGSSVSRILSRESHLVVFSRNLKALSVRSWLRTALLGVALSMFTVETSEIIRDVSRYVQVRNLPYAISGAWLAAE